MLFFYSYIKFKINIFVKCWLIFFRINPLWPCALITSKWQHFLFLHNPRCVIILWMTTVAEDFIAFTKMKPIYSMYMFIIFIPFWQSYQTEHSCHTIAGVTLQTCHVHKWVSPLCIIILRTELSYIDFSHTTERWYFINVDSGFMLQHIFFFSPPHSVRTNPESRYWILVEKVSSLHFFYLPPSERNLWLGV